MKKIRKNEIKIASLKQKQKTAITMKKGNKNEDNKMKKITIKRRK